MIHEIAFVGLPATPSDHGDPADSVILEEEIDENYEPTHDGAQTDPNLPYSTPVVAHPLRDLRRAVSSPQGKKMPRHPPSRPRLTPPAPPSTALSRAEMIDYTKWLGMDLETEKDLMWIARGSRRRFRSTGNRARLQTPATSLLQLPNRRERLGPPVRRVQEPVRGGEGEPGEAPRRRTPTPRQRRGGRTTGHRRGVTGPHRRGHPTGHRRAG